MIGSLRGKILEIQAPDILIEVNGIGYEVAMPMTSIYELPSVGSEVFIYTHLSIREDAHSLYGFTTKEAKLLYRELVKINGVGPKLALAVLSAYTPDQFVMAIKKENLAQIVKIPGVGKKTAERLLIELKDRLANFNVVSSDSVDALVEEKDNNARVVIDVDIENQAVIALVGLGFKQQQAETMVRKNYKDGMKVEDIIRESLKNN
jgi:Holliday junction DNA helicase RuvA